VPADPAYPEVEVAEDDAVVCSLVAAPAAAGEEVAWCEIRRNGGDASSATIRNLRYCAARPWTLVRTFRARSGPLLGARSVKGAVFPWW